MCLCFFSLSSVCLSWLFFIFSRLIIAALCFFSVFSFCWLYYVPVLMKGYAMLVLFMHLFCLMNPKGRKFGKWKIDHIELSISIKIGINNQI